MKIKGLIIPVLIWGLCLNLISQPNLAASVESQEIQAQEAPLIIPDTVKAAMKEGILTRQPRLDIPFSIVKHYFLPAQQNMHIVLLFKAKNSDLGFAPVTADSERQKKKKEKEQEAPSIFESSPNKLYAQHQVFIQFNKLEDNNPGELVKEVYIPFNLEVDGTSYDPDKEEIYSFGYPLPPGDYLLTIAITSQDLEKIGTQYFEFSLPNALSFSGELETTPLFFAKSVNTMSGVEPQTEIHKDFFTYSILQIEPNVDNTLSPTDYIDLFFYILGTQPNEQRKFDIEINYTVYKGEEVYVRFQPQTYDNPLISQPLPLKRTVLIKSEQGEKTETRDLEDGTYTLSIEIKDKISESTLKKTIDFEIKS